MHTTGPPITRRPCALALSAAARDVAQKQAEQPEIPEARRSIPLDQQALDPLEPKTRVTGAKAVLSPRHVLVAEIFVEHRGLLRRGC